MKIRKSISQLDDVEGLRCKVMKNIVVNSRTGCHEWGGSLNYEGYGQAWFCGKTWSVHRVSYEINHGPIAQDDAEWWVLHKCDNPACCNPEHLFKGSPSDNARDCADKKRKRRGYHTLSAAYGRETDPNKLFGTVFYEYKGEVKKLSEWAEIMGLNPITLDQRFEAGWPEDDIPMATTDYKRHLRAECTAVYKRFSGWQEVIDYLATKQQKSEATSAGTVVASSFPEPTQELDMASITTQITTINVPFHGANLFVVSHSGEPFVPMKPVVEGMGLTWQSQNEKLKHRFAKGVTEIVIPSAGGKQAMTCLALRKLNGWLQTISPNKVKPEIREAVIQYQEECDDVLYEYWTKGQVTNPRKVKKIAAGKITADQQEAIKQLVMNRGHALPKDKQAKAIITMWSSLKSHFGCSYKDIGEEQFTEALSLAARVPLEGEFLGKQEALPAETVKQFTDEELCKLCWLWNYCCNMASYMLDIEPLLRVAEHRLAGAYYSTPIESTRTLNAARRMLQRETMHIECNNWTDDNWRVLNKMRIDHLSFM